MLSFAGSSSSIGSPLMTFAPRQHSYSEFCHAGHMASTLVSPDGSWRANARNTIKTMVAQDRLTEAHLMMGVMHMHDARMTDVVSLNLIMSNYKRRNLIRQCLEVFHQMRCANVEPDQVSFNIAIDACGKARQLQSAFYYLGEMRAAGWPPTVSTYTSLIDACGKCRMLDYAEGLLEQMQLEGVSPNSCTYTALVKASCMAGDRSRALRVVERIHYALSIHASELCPTPFVTAIRACTDHGELGPAFQALTLMTTSRLVPDPLTLSMLVDACNVCGRPDLALEVYRVFRSSGVHPRRTMGRGDGPSGNMQFSNTLQLLADRGDLASAYELILLCAECEWTLCPSGPVCVRLLEAAVRACEVDFAFAMLPAVCAGPSSHWCAPGLAPHGVERSLLILFEACAASASAPDGADLGRLLTVLSYYQQSSSAAANVGMYAKLLDVCPEAELVEMLVEHHAMPRTGQSADAFLDACAQRKAFVCAQDLLRSLEKTHSPSSKAAPPRPSTAAAARLLKACDRLVSTHEEICAAFNRLRVPVESEISPVSILSPAPKQWRKEDAGDDDVGALAEAMQGLSAGAACPTEAGSDTTSPSTVDGADAERGETSHNTHQLAPGPKPEERATNDTGANLLATIMGVGTAPDAPPPSSPPTSPPEEPPANGLGEWWSEA